MVAKGVIAKETREDYTDRAGSLPEGPVVALGSEVEVEAHTNVPPPPPPPGLLLQDWLLRPWHQPPFWPTTTNKLVPFSNRNFDSTFAPLPGLWMQQRHQY